jgi:hypothetical protein
MEKAGAAFLKACNATPAFRSICSLRMNTMDSGEKSSEYFLLAITLLTTIFSPHAIERLLTK